MSFLPATFYLLIFGAEVFLERKCDSQKPGVMHVDMVEDVVAEEEEYLVH